MTDDATHHPRIATLSEEATRRNPLGLRVAVLERSAMLHEAGGLTWAEADEMALEMETTGQRSLFGA